MSLKANLETPHSLEPFRRHLVQASNVLVTLNSAVNFIVYCMISRKFRELLVRHCCCCCTSACCFFVIIKRRTSGSNNSEPRSNPTPAQLSSLLASQQQQHQQQQLVEMPQVMDVTAS